jgi:glycosyltransferase involved in cell wall biosynthesis
MSARQFGPTISVITPCLNGVRYIAEAIESVLRQGYSNTEHIVADGGSSDGTTQILSRYQHLRILDSPDRGMYDALNKALAIAQGDLIGILNSDDCYAEGAFSSVVEAFRDESVMALVGEANTFRDAANGDRIVVDELSPIGVDLLFRSTLGDPSINAWFFRSSVFAQLGRFDAWYRVAGDREFMLRFALSGFRFAEIDKLIYRYRMHSASMTFEGNEEIWETVLREHNKMTELYLRKAGLTKRARELIKRARTRDTLSGAIYSAKRYDLLTLVSHAIAGTRHDPIWPARFAIRTMRELALKIRVLDRAGMRDVV